MSSLTPKTSWMTTTPGHGPSPTGGVATNAGRPVNSTSGMGLDQHLQRSRGHQVLQSIPRSLERERAGDQRLRLDVAAGDQVDRALPGADRAEDADQVDVADDQAVEVERDLRAAGQAERHDPAARADGVE